jgi:hypothetical protein
MVCKGFSTDFIITLSVTNLFIATAIFSFNAIGLRSITTLLVTLGYTDRVTLGIATKVGRLTYSICAVYKNPLFKLTVLLTSGYNSGMKHLRLTLFADSGNPIQNS